MELLGEDAQQVELRHIAIDVDQPSAPLPGGDSAFLMRFAGLATLLGNLRQAASVRIACRRCARYLPRVVCDALQRATCSQPMHLVIAGEGAAFSLELLADLLVARPEILSALTLRIPSLSALSAEGLAAKARAARRGVARRPPQPGRGRAGSPPPAALRRCSDRPRRLRPRGLR